MNTLLTRLENLVAISVNSVVYKSLYLDISLPIVLTLTELDWSAAVINVPEGIIPEFRYLP